MTHQRRLSSVSSLSVAEPGSNGLVIFTLDDIMKMTENFSIANKIGEGDYGLVYKGKLQDGTWIAVKKSKEDTCIEEFHKEVNICANIDHLNIVKVIGYAAEGNERIIVQEYVSNGNLRNHLDCVFGSVLDIFARLNISIEVAHALNYLHHYSDTPMIHKDVKSSNVLLTKSLKAKLEDSSLLRAGLWNSSSGTNNSMRFWVKRSAYVDPDFGKTFALTKKSDVYSFGILLLEILTAQRPFDHPRSAQERITIQWATQNFIEDKITDMLDPRLQKNPVTLKLAKKMFEIALKCCASREEARPEMMDVSRFLWDIRKSTMFNIAQSISLRGPTLSNMYPDLRIEDIG